jgi:L-ribulose-5-phosphate 4-epimerase
MLEDLKRQVLEANLSLVRHKLVLLTFGNVSGIDRKTGLVVIKPSGVAYDKLTLKNLAVVSLEGKVVEGRLRPSSDTPTHLALYRAWPEVNAVCHTHSAYATVFCQARVPIPCLGTTHADHFFGPIPLTRPLTRQEVQKNYEANTGKVIIELFAKRGAKGRGKPNPLDMPAALVADHGPFSWGRDAEDAVNNSVLLEEVARLAFKTMQLSPKARPVPSFLRNYHFLRKHGPNPSYGQNKKF